MAGQEKDQLIVLFPYHKEDAMTEQEKDRLLDQLANFFAEGEDSKKMKEELKKESDRYIRFLKKFMEISKLLDAIEKQQQGN